MSRNSYLSLIIFVFISVIAFTVVLVWFFIAQNFGIISNQNQASSQPSTIEILERSEVEENAVVPAPLIKIKEDNKSILFEGDVVISGSYSEALYPSVYSGIICFSVESDYQDIMPKSIFDDRMYWFCFENQEEAKLALGISDDKIDFKGNCARILGEAKIRISNYIINKDETAIYDRAKLVEVIENKGPDIVDPDEQGCIMLFNERG